MALAPNTKGQIKGTKGKDKIVWQNKKPWKKALTVDAGAGNDTVSNYKDATSVFGKEGNDKISNFFR